MSSRHRIIYLGMIILMLISGILFADANNPPYEIISPIISQNGDVIKEQHLLISLRLNQDLDATLTLTRIDEPKVVVASNEAARKLKSIANQAPTQAVNAGDGGSDPVVQVSKKDLLVDDDSRENVQMSFYKAGVNLESAYDEYMEQYSLARKAIDSDKLQQLVNQRKLLQSNLKNLHVARQAYERAAIIFHHISTKYEALFRVTIVDKASISFQGALPIYNLTVRDIQPGKYELLIHDKTTGKRIGDRVIFFLKSPDRATEEIIDRVKENITDIWKKSN